MPDDVAALERLTRVLVAVAWDSAHAAPRGVTFPQVRLLVVLDSLGRVPCSRLAEVMGVNASSVTRLADKLEAHGYVVRGEDEHRRTVVTIEVTAAGREVVAGGRRQVPARAVRAARGSACRAERGGLDGGPRPGHGGGIGIGRAHGGAGPAVKVPARAAHLGDFAVNPRMLLITAIALPVGGAAAVAAFALLKLIGLITNLVFYQRVATDLVAPGAQHHPWWLVLLAPVVGGLVIGLMARYGSEKIRGHGMPEAIEAILTGGSRVAPRGAVLKPVSAAVSIGTGGPFGAEGPRGRGADHHDRRRGRFDPSRSC
ncbi:MarR family transcriptional regulator [Amycolatopsis rubida]|uniref:MarR family transcriptional regulator n=1 Tax=Amycolatopsis rubida TaxID=112413 RepID=UPI00244E779C|nr:MarR family transcriptional regulator [Amycolatopsis rubida]